MTRRDRTAIRTAARAAAGLRPPTCTPPSDTRRARRDESFDFGFAFGFGCGVGGGGGVGVVVVVPVVDIVSVVDVVESVDIALGRGPASTDAARKPPTPRL